MRTYVREVVEKEYVNALSASMMSHLSSFFMMRSYVRCVGRETD